MLPAKNGPTIGGTKVKAIQARLILNSTTLMGSAKYVQLILKPRCQR